MWPVAAPANGHFLADAETPREHLNLFADAHATASTRLAASYARTSARAYLTAPLFSLMNAGPCPRVLQLRSVLVAMDHRAASSSSLMYVAISLLPSRRSFPGASAPVVTNLWRFALHS